jgi:hypothetical protein
LTSMISISPSSSPTNIDGVYPLNVKYPWH